MYNVGGNYNDYNKNHLQLQRSLNFCMVYCYLKGSLKLAGFGNLFQGMVNEGILEGGCMFLFSLRLEKKLKGLGTFQKLK